MGNRGKGKVRVHLMNVVPRSTMNTNGVFDVLHRLAGSSAKYVERKL